MSIKNLRFLSEVEEIFFKRRQVASIPHCVGWLVGRSKIWQNLIGTSIGVFKDSMESIAVSFNELCQPQTTKRRQVASIPHCVCMLVGQYVKSWHNWGLHEITITFVCGVCYEKWACSM